MGFGRDLGAALTMGLSATTKHKEAEKAHEKRCDAYQRRINAFNEVLQKTASSMQRLDGEYQSARDVLISSGARTIDADGNVDYGWYRPIEGMDTEGSSTEHNQALIGTLPAFGVAIGVPAITWTLVGAFGTAATGTAISALSGAAAGAATAAWIGRAATLGLAGMTAGRVALGPIALLSMPVQAAIGAKVAGNRERKAIQQFGDQTKEMDRLEGIMSNLRGNMAAQDHRANTIAANLSRHAGQLETAKPGSGEANQAASRLDLDMRQAIEMLHEFAETAATIQEQLGEPVEN